MASIFENVLGGGREKRLEYKETGIDVDGEPIYAPVVALEPLSIGGGGGGVLGTDINVTDRAARLLGHVTVDNASFAVTGPLTDAQLRASAVASDVSDRVARLLGHVTVDNASLAVTGPLTDTQLRTSAVPVSLPGTQPVSGPLTDTQLRASAVPTDVNDRVARLLGHVTVDNASLAVTGPLTDAQLRAAAVPVSGAFFQATQPISAATLPTHDVVDQGEYNATRPTFVTGNAGRMQMGSRGSIRTQLAVADSNLDIAATNNIPVGTEWGVVVRPIQVSAPLVGTTISAANTAVTLTLAAVAAQFHYITSIEIVALNPTITAIAAAATNLAFTTTNLGGIAWNAGTLLAAGAEKVITRLQFGPALRSTTVNTATTIVAPAIGAGGLVRITVTYYTAA
jgi:hypothetical protein